jgi:hypothetical protein
MQEPTPELEALLNAVYRATIGITNQTCPMYNAVRGTYGDDVCYNICLFGDAVDGKCKIRVLKMANFAYRASLLKEREVPAYIPGNPDQSDPAEELEILDVTE